MALILATRLWLAVGRGKSLTIGHAPNRRLISSLGVFKLLQLPSLFVRALQQYHLSFLSFVLRDLLSRWVSIA